MKLLGELVACLAMFTFLLTLLVFGYAATPYLPSPANEEVYNGQ